MGCSMGCSMAVDVCTALNRTDGWFSRHFTPESNSIAVAVYVWLPRDDRVVLCHWEMCLPGVGFQQQETDL